MSKPSNPTAMAKVGLFLIALLSAGADLAQTNTPVSVKVYVRHIGYRFVYSYRIVNNSQFKIAAVWVGRDGDRDVWELSELPAGWSSDAGIPPDSATSPAGWHVYVINPEESEVHAVAWGAIADNSPRILPGQAVSEMSVALEKADVSYRSGHALVLFSDRFPTSVTVPLELGDTTAPTLSLTLHPATLWPPNGKSVPVTATLTVKDDYDPQPEIKLESITANEPLDPDDIADAATGTDDRQFRLKARRAGTNPAGRLYTITYSATDASGNKTTASATVTVPHDQGK